MVGEMPRVKDFSHRRTGRRGWSSPRGGRTCARRTSFVPGWPPGWSTTRWSGSRTRTPRCNSSSRSPADKSCRAAQASVPSSVEDPERDASVNVMGLLNVLECAAATGTRKVVFAASGGTLYGEPKSIPVKEGARNRARPISPYGISKAIALDYLSFYQRTRTVDFAALALANVYGPRQDPFGEAGVIAIFAAKMLAGETPTIFGDGGQTRDFVFVDDTVHAFSLAADRGAGAVLNVGTGVETTVNGLFELMAATAQFRGSASYGPERPGDLRRNALDPSLAEKELGWRPWTSLEEGLKATVEALRPS